MQGVRNQQISSAGDIEAVVKNGEIPTGNGDIRLTNLNLARRI